MSLPDILPQQFRFESTLGESSRGSTHRGLWLETQQIVALKLFSSPRLTAAFRPSLAAESGVFRTVRSPYVQSPIAAGTEGTPYAVYPLLDGRDLRTLVSSGAVGTSFVRRIATDLVAGLDDLQRHGLSHRALTLGNVMVTTAGQAIAMDLGLAAEHLTEPAGGTAEEMALWEELQLADSGGSADVFGLGMILYTLLAGKSPFAGRPAAQGLRGAGAITPLAEIRGDIDLPLADLTMRCLDRNPRERLSIATIRQVLVRLKAASTQMRASPMSARVHKPQGVNSALDHTVRPANRRPKRAPAALAAAFILALLALTLVAAKLWTMDPSSPIRPVPARSATSSPSR